jgi:hypothetical protein
VTCAGPQNLEAEIASLSELLQSIGALPTGDPAVDGMRMDLEEAIRERKPMRGMN